jgi:hypothetical protein
MTAIFMKRLLVGVVIQSTDPKSQPALEETPELLVGQTSLVEDRLKGTPLQVAVVIRKSDARAGPAGMFQDVMAA